MEVFGYKETVFAIKISRLKNKLDGKKDDNINAYINNADYTLKTKIIKIETDLLNNEIYFTELNYTKHLVDNFGESRLEELQKKIIETIKNPDFVLKEIKKGTIVYGKYFNKQIFISSIIGEDSRRYYTVYERDKMFDKLNERYKILYDVKGIEK